MADRSKNEQYDIVAQAEDVLRLYVKRYFDLSCRTRAKKPKGISAQNKVIIAGTVICLALSALLVALMYFI